MSYLIKSDFLLIKKNKNLPSLYENFIKEIHINNYKFYHILKICINNLKEIFAKDSYDKMIDKFL